MAPTWEAADAIQVLLVLNTEYFWQKHAKQTKKDCERQEPRRIMKDRYLKLESGPLNVDDELRDHEVKRFNNPEGESSL